ncbi:MAG: hypothetical protein IJ752_00130 [Alphaproteobacteria bacterium]|nr:hypothetical protein [Alphaproteobacteria bacterium]
MSNGSFFLVASILFIMLLFTCFPRLFLTTKQPEQTDEEIRKDLKEEGMSDEEIDAFLKELNEDADNFVKAVQNAKENDVIQRNREI